MTHVKFNRRPFERSFNNFVDDIFTDLPVLVKSELQQLGLKGTVPVNIVEKEKAYILEVVAPGFDKGDFKVNLDQNVLTVSAEKKEEVKNENEKSIRKEFNYRSFKRSFTIDEKIESAGIEGEYVNGVLTLNLPKKEIVKGSAQEINIK